jgi:hypothetical protein
MLVAVDIGLWQVGTAVIRYRLIVIREHTIILVAVHYVRLAKLNHFQVLTTVGLVVKGNSRLVLDRHNVLIARLEQSQGGAQVLARRVVKAGLPSQDKRVLTVQATHIRTLQHRMNASIVQRIQNQPDLV